MIQCNNIFDTNILSRGRVPKLKNYGKFQGGGRWGGGGMTSTPWKEIPAGWREHKLKCPPWGREEGGNVYFLELHISGLHLASDYV